MTCPRTRHSVDVDELSAVRTAQLVLSERLRLALTLYDVASVRVTAERTDQLAVAETLTSRRTDQLAAVERVTDERTAHDVGFELVTCASPPTFQLVCTVRVTCWRTAYDVDRLRVIAARTAHSTSAVRVTARLTAQLDAALAVTSLVPPAAGRSASSPAVPRVADDVTRLTSPVAPEPDHTRYPALDRHAVTLSTSSVKTSGTVGGVYVPPADELVTPK